jgi:hypothetical protein
MSYSRLWLVLPFLTSWCMQPQAAYAEIEWNVTKQLQLEATPLDAVPSADGRNLFVLTPGEVLVYVQPEYRLVTRIPVEKGMDRMAYSAKDNRLVLTGGAGKSVKIIQLENVHRFSLDGLFVKGPRNAPVTLAVFSDYQ